MVGGWERERGGGGLIFTYFSKGFQMGARVWFLAQN
jgi:hypothetical protein